MKCYKEKELIIFDFEDGKRATYNMNTGETIGKCGKPVQSLSSALAGYSIEGVLNSFTDTKYRDFLLEVHKYKTPHSYTYRNNGSRVKNLGTLLRYANGYKIYEQYFIAGLKADWHIDIPLKEVPKGLLKLCRRHDKVITWNLIQYYKRSPDIYNVAFSMEFESLRADNLWSILENIIPNNHTTFYRWNASHALLTRFNYNLKALLKYVDYLVTFEGLEPNGSIMTEIGDYANMMDRISNKFDKYPRCFLTTHKIAARNYNRLKEQFDEIAFQKRITPEYEITYKDWKFFYPRTTQEIKDEAVQQNNCVASYIERVISGDSHILFLRKKDNPTKSVVTIQVRNGKIVQHYQAYNTPCTEEQLEAIAAFNKKFSKEK